MRTSMRVALSFAGLVLGAVLALTLSGCGGTDQPAAPMLPAFYSLQGEDLRGEPYNGQPVVTPSEWGLLVCNADLDPDDVRAAAPGAVALVYLDVRWVARWGGSGSTYQKMRDWFPEDAYWSGPQGRIALWPDTWELRYTRANADLLASFAAHHLAGWDGIYLDDLKATGPSPASLDVLVGGDAEKRAAVLEDWYGYTDRLVESLRTLMPDAKLVGNVGGFDATRARRWSLDGITAEEHWPAQQGAFLNEARRYDPRYCVAWQFPPSAAPFGEPGSPARWGEIRYR